MPDGMPFPFLLAGEALATVSTVVHKVPNLFRYSLAFREQASSCRNTKTAVSLRLTAVPTVAVRGGFEPPVR